MIWTLPLVRLPPLLSSLLHLREPLSPLPINHRPVQVLQQGPKRLPCLDPALSPSLPSVDSAVLGGGDETFGLDPPHLVIVLCEREGGLEEGLEEGLEGWKKREPGCDGGALNKMSIKLGD